MDNNINESWTDKNINIIRSWKINLFKLVYIYNVVLEKYKSKVNSYLITAMIFGYISTLLGAIISALLGINKHYVWPSFGLSVVISVINMIITILNSCLSIKGWSPIVTKYTLYIDKIDDLYIMLSNTLLLLEKSKIDADIFIEVQNKIYLNLLNSAPSILPSDYMEGYKKYIEYIETDNANNIIEQKYGKNDDIINVI